MARLGEDSVFVAKINPSYVVVAFGVGNASAAAGSLWPGVLAASPVVASPVNGSDFVYCFASREEGAFFLGHVVGAGYHGWLMSAYNIAFLYDC
jgi:hypothetical protein